MQNNSKFQSVDGGKRGPEAARQKAKRPASYQRMYHERALGLLSPEQRELIKDFFDQDGKQIVSIKTLEPGPERKALGQYGKAKEEVFQRIKKRQTEGGKLIISVPIFIWLQPDLSFLEKHLLADIYELQQKPLGCFKGNRAFAVEVGTTAGNIKDMLHRLKSLGFLRKQTGDEGRRLLMLSKHFLELVGQSPLTDPAVPTDHCVSRD